MIVGIGTDIVEIARFDGLLERHGDAFAERILSVGEYTPFFKSQASLPLSSQTFCRKRGDSKSIWDGIC
ncbi:4'-phosphopantetheinyl transferase superfamily protein [Piscirickettsia litoralis]|uniref:4'-phosphopantetheinyl transferase superfamily protein n=1 Tax=Piscirickettsia litoralis TaxID=1891921 RepID=UPI000B31BFA8|nr:4'-phosphopantetheinyl transferase superfamily protein [Piscirickettsia litoralis]